MPLFEPFVENFGGESQILLLKTLLNEVPQMAGLGLFFLYGEPLGKIAQHHGHGHNVRFCAAATSGNCASHCCWGSRACAARQ